MVVQGLLNYISSLVFRILQQYKSKEELLIANNRLVQVLLELEKARLEEENKALKLEKDLNFQRERLGRDLHDCFGSQLTHIISRLDLLTTTNNLDLHQLLRINEFAREMNQTLRETIWVLDQESITAIALGTRLHSMLLKIWEDRDAPILNWQFKNIAENKMIQPFLALQIIRIVQEATNNALKYASASQVTVKVTVKKNKLLLNIIDNGCGFDADIKRHGYGISNIGKRAEELRGCFRLTSSSSGTCIDVWVPIV